eukprot:214398_1
MKHSTFKSHQKRLQKCHSKRTKKAPKRHQTRRQNDTQKTSNMSLFIAKHMIGEGPKAIDDQKEEEASQEEEEAHKREEEPKLETEALKEAERRGRSSPEASSKVTQK